MNDKRMGNKFLNRKAEDILSDEVLSEKLLNKEQPAGDEEVLSSQISEIIAHRKASWKADEKNALQKEISKSIARYRTRKSTVRISSVAVVVLVIGLTVFFQSTQESAVLHFARNNQFEVTDSIQLILSNKNEVMIGSTESKITYASNGNQIKIDSLPNIEQQIEANESAINTLVVPYGRRTRITLSDDTKIWLNSGSKLVYPARFTDATREVYLEGEAIFEVSHDRDHPFMVRTPELDVRVLGTVFCVSSYNDDPLVNTILESGSVELSFDSKTFWRRSKVQMNPGMLAVYNQENGVIEQRKVNTRHYTSWRDGYFITDKQPLTEILRKISRYYNVSIHLSDENIGKETFSGYLDLKSSPVEVLEAIGEIINARIENTNNQFVINKLYK